MISIENLYQHFLECKGVCTDTRQISQDVLFVALKGDSFNGNAFAAQALEAGAKYALIDEAQYEADERFLLVEDALTALQELANYHRKQFNIPVIGLTGSNGKTTTKELVAAVLSKKYRTLFTKGNLNNHIGVPLTLLSLKKEHEIAVVEMGANHQGEIRDLCHIAEPTHGLITNIGKAHLEGFGGVEGVKKGKGELYDYLAQHQGTIFINSQNKVIVEEAAKRTFKETIYYLKGELELIEESPNIIYRSHPSPQPPEGALKVSPLGVRGLYLSGHYNFENMAAAHAIGQYFGVEENQIHEAITSYNPTNNRSQTMQKGSNTLYLDAYNANPSSMAVAIENFARLKADKKIVILGDMYELGDATATEHEALGKLLAQKNFDTVVLAGKHTHHALVALPNAYYFPDKFSLHNWLQDRKIEKAHILIKGSRGMGLESVVPFLGK